MVSGRGVGSKQTVPTLNLATQAEVIPASGVYITRTRDLDNGREWNSVTNIGYRPTFGASDQLTIETFLLDPLSGESPSAHPRGVPPASPRGAQVRYSGSLRGQILKDVRTAQACFRRVKAWTEPQCISC